MNQYINVTKNSIVLPRQFGNNVYTVSDMDINVNDYKWEEKLLYLYDMSYVNVLYTLDNNSKILLRPNEKKNNFYFEELFGFGYECENYDTNKVIRFN